MANDKKKSKDRVRINMDTTPILYTDNINISINKDGAVVNIMQRIGKDQVRVVARIGMSRDHAKEFVEKFGKLLISQETNSLIMTARGNQTGKKKLN